MHGGPPASVPCLSKSIPAFAPLVKLKITLSDPAGRRRWLEKERTAGRYEPELGTPRVRGEKKHLSPEQREALGSPPRARGKGAVCFLAAWGLGITPACAGESSAPSRCSIPSRDHPRVRGEKSRPFWAPVAMRGSPPRARGKDAGDIRPRRTPGITPACAGKSLEDWQTGERVRDHPRVRGEKIFAPCSAGRFWGSPPRARGKGCPGPPRKHPAGITPACAGKRHLHAEVGNILRDHPRVRGEKNTS